MNRSELLEEVLLDDGMIAFKEALRARSIEELAASRRPRLRWIVAAAAALLIMTRLVFWPAPMQQPKPDYFVTTAALSADHRIVRASTVSIVTTVPSPTFARVKSRSSVDRLTDDEMLAMFTGIPCGLVGRKLVFINPEDEKRFFGKLGG